MFDRNNFNFIITLILLTSFMFWVFGTLVYSAKENTKSFSTSARSAALYEPETKNFIYEKNIDERLPMASTTKIMTALLTLENCSLDELCQVDDNAVGIEGSSAYLKAGEVLTVEQLLYALLLQSANDAAVALSIYISQSVDEFAKVMNDRANQIGATSTCFANPHGLDDIEHFTTARDLALIAAEALQNEDFVRIVSTKNKSFSTENGERTYINHNKLLKLYEGCIGIKTGFTKKSGRCLVGASDKDGLRFVTVTLDAPDDWKDHEKMFDLGYDTLQKINFAYEGEHIYKIPVIGGAENDVLVSNLCSSQIILPKSNYQVDQYIKLVRFAVAPIYEGEILGEIIYTVDGEKMGCTFLTAVKTVEKTQSNRLWNKLLSLFNIH